MAFDNLKSSEGGIKELIIFPQGKRKHKIIFKAIFSDEIDDLEIKKVLSNTMGGIGLFDYKK